MSKFKKKTGTSQEIPTSALPDIIFMLLFFFMVTTVMRTDDLLITQKLPQASQLSKIEKKSLVSYIFIGTPKEVTKYGDEPKIQANGVLMEPEDIALFVEQEKTKLPESDRNKITMSMKISQEAKMGIVTDVQEELKKANARKILYASTPKLVK
ncbi:ExbD/TolR family protein [Aureibacter tunicatorum]|uniref:Biopolymer transport protein ExbD n=1 Tax=Aureibacter tunicatorum TaxID=866807 RepID=A0AAE3XSL9_9BACT|nr:biopolymer transporter ExbD [Aureibacter tunicatorum]MDR6241274.1 biopolymer transport protein ExbD [Aureibacter tunicatorum]BDD03534.1 biopolymer transporter ExbD [Aureibacter tunicatorum]